MGSFNPTQISGLKLWADAADPDTLYTDAGTTKVTADADLVYQWNDKSGNGYHLSQATEGFRPLYKTGILNGRSVVRFQGTDDRMANAAFYNFATNDQITAFVVASTSAATTQYIMQITQNPFYSRGPQLYYASASGVYWEIPDTVGTQYVSDATGTPAVAAQIYTGQWDAAATTMPAWTNGTAFDTTDTVTTSTHTIDRIFLGSRVDGTLPLTGDIAEVILYDPVLTSAQLNRVGHYLSAKYAISWTDIA